MREQFEQALLALQQLCYEIDSNLKWFLLAAFPNLSALREDNTSCSPRLMIGLVEAAHGKLPDSTCATLIKVIEGLDACNGQRRRWHQITDASVDLAPELEKCLVATKRLKQSLDRLDKLKPSITRSVT